MNSLVILAIVTVVLPTATSSIKCFSSETQSHPKCFVQKNTVNSVSCDSTQYTCGTTQYKLNGVRHYLRGCVAKTNCLKTDRLCKGQPKDGRTNCKFYCCAGDYSNKGLTCSACVSNKSDADCFKHIRDEDCPLDQEYRCVRSSYHFMGGTVYFRGCLRVKECNPVEYCKTLKGKTNCVTQCCQGDLCNSNPSSTYGRKCKKAP